METVIETERLYLRIINAPYARQVLDFYNANREYFEPWEPERAVNFYTEDFQRINLTCEYNQIMKAHFLRYWLFTKENPSKIIGTVCYNNIIRGAFQSCMIGYKISKEYCRHGFATEACDITNQLIFQTYGFHRIEALVHPSNLPSMQLLEKLGFFNEGLCRSCVHIYGHWEDHFRYAKVAKDI